MPPIGMAEMSSENVSKWITRLNPSITSIAEQILVKYIFCPCNPDIVIGRFGIK